MADAALLTDEDVFGAPVRRRGGMRSEFSPYVAQGTDYDPRAGIRGQDGYGMPEDDGLLSDADVFGSTRRERVAVPDATLGSAARDIASGVLQIGPTVVKGAADLARLATGDRVGKDTSDAMEVGMGSIRSMVGSERAAAQRQNFQADMADDNVGVWDALSNNKGAIADQILPTLGSMVLPMGAAGAAGKLATLGRAAQGMDKAALAARVASAQTAAGVGATAAQNAADTFSELVDRGVSLGDAYVAAGITVPFSVIAGKLTGGGAEMAAVRALTGRGAERGVMGGLMAAGREGAQEVIEESGQITGEAVATDTMPSMTSVGKQLGVAGTLGAIVGGGVNVAGQAAGVRPPSAADELGRALEDSVANSEFTMSADEAARRALNPTNYIPPTRDPVDTILDPTTPPDKPLLDLFNIPAVDGSPRAAAKQAAAPTPPQVDALTEDYVFGQADIRQTEVQLGKGPAAAQADLTQPVPQAADPAELRQETGNIPEGVAPASPNYEITESGTLLVNRPISEVRPLAPGAWMIRAPGGGTLVGRTAASTVQAALDAEAPVDTVNVSPERVEIPAGNEQVAAIPGAEAAQFKPEQPPVAPGAQATAAATVPDYSTNRDGTLIINAPKEALAPFIPDVKLIQTGRGTLVGRTAAAEVSAHLAVAKDVPESFKTEQEARALAQAAGMPADTEVGRTDNGYVLLPPMKVQTAEQVAAASSAVDRLSIAINRNQTKATGVPVELVPDAELAQQGPAGVMATKIVQAVRSVLNVPVSVVRNLTSDGAYHEGRVYLDTKSMQDGSKGVRGFVAKIFGVVGHEVEHYFENSKDAADRSTNAKLRLAIKGYYRDGVIQKRQVEEQAQRTGKLQARYGANEVRADISGGMWLDNKFWSRLVELDNGSTARKVFYRFMQATTRLISAAKGSKLDVDVWVTNKAAVREAYAQAWASRFARQGAKTGAGATQTLGAVPEDALFGKQVAFSQSDTGGGIGSRLSAMGFEKQPVKHVQGARNLATLIKELDDGKVSPAMFETKVRLLSKRMADVSETKAANRILSERVRGADVLRERLIAARRRGELENDTVEFGLWAIDLNPAIVEDLGISIKSPPDGKTGVAGEYNRFAKVIRLFKGSQNTGTAVHEILHHTERMMPPEVQGGVSEAWSKAVAKAAKDATPEQRKAIQALIEGSLGDKAAEKEAMQAFRNGVLDYDQHYQLTNPSEFWAVNATRILQGRFAADSWPAKAKQWLKEMMQKVKALLGLSSDAPILRGLQAVLDGDGSQQSKVMLSEKAMTMRDIKPTAVTVDRTPEGYPEVHTARVSIAAPTPTERFEIIPQPGQEVLNYAIMPPREGDFGVLGHVELLVENGRPVSLLDIEIYDKGKGAGDATIEALLAAFPDADLNISNIVENARGFWDKMGVPEQNRAAGEAYDGTLNWNTYSQRKNSRGARGAAGSGARAGSQPVARGEGQDRGGQGNAQGQTSNVQLSQAESVTDKQIASLEREADAYAQANDIRPYVPARDVSIPVAKAEPVGPVSFSQKEVGKYGNDPVHGLPLNKNNTVTLYYPTTAEGARIATQERVLRPQAGEDRIYLTNESSGWKVMSAAGPITQKMDGSAVLVQVSPNLLHALDTEGRRDFFIPVAEGQSFRDKMQRLWALNAPRNRAISADTTMARVRDGVKAGVDGYLALDNKQRRAALKAARETLARHHNVTTLLGVNGKLEKTNSGDYGLTYDGKSVISMGLGMASAQRINDKLSTCPQSAACEGLCLGDTSGQNLLYGGAADPAWGSYARDFRAGPRLSQYLKTEAFILHPEEFAVVLQAEIMALEKWAAANDYQSSIRLNVTTDFPPTVWEALIKAHPGTFFYDYTKLNTVSIAPNHHLTYSSTGASQDVRGKRIVNPHSNWDRMVGHLNKGRNVAMAFSSRKSMPDFVIDERTGAKFQVWNGDNYDARFLDPKRPDGIGMIVGLTNKDKTGKPEEAAEKNNGFFIDYDRERDGDTVTIPKQERQAIRIESGLSLSQSDPATRYAGVIIEQPILIEDTGQTATLRIDAGQAIADLDEKAQKMRRLLDCLG